jgi:hypothetical protein
VQEVIGRIPNRPLTNGDISKYAEILGIPYFRGVFMRDFLPSTIMLNESAVVNLDSIRGPGTHWVCYVKKGNLIKYFDSFGNLRPPLELEKYFHSASQTPSITYNYFAKQKESAVNCGHLCLSFLAEQT